MALADLMDWMDLFGRPGTVWYAKRLAANDTLATNAHQAGPYIPKELLFRVFPSLNRPDLENPDVSFNLYVDSHLEHRTVRAVWYNNKVRGTGTRNEARVTGFGGRQSAVLDPSSTGAISVFVFVLSADGPASECHVWVSRDEAEEDLIEERLGPVEPKELVFWEPGTIREARLFSRRPQSRPSCRLDASEIPPEWLTRFPTGEQIIQKTIELCAALGTKPDVRLVRRRQCEYEVFQSIEKAIYLPRIRPGFQTVEGFLNLAQTILQSRKSRSGNSLELHSRQIFVEEGLRPNRDFSYRPIIEGGKRPDFLFPSQTSYETPSFPDVRLRMLAAKATVKDRWRQILNEANRISIKHLLTLQEGVSEGQFREMREARVQLVVPQDLHAAYPLAIRPRLISLESFIAEVRSLRIPAM